MPADAWGITDAYDDARGERRSTPAATRQALRAAMGGDLADPRPPGDAPVVVVTRESGPATLAPGELFLEDGARLRVAGLLPPDVPLGYHELHPHGGGAPVRVIVCPPVCRLPEGLRTWGWAAQLYGVRSVESWGIGDLATFSALAEHHGRGWNGWPEEHRHPASPGVARFRAAHEDRVRFHQWLQWLADEQLRQAAESLRVIQDLPIGVDANGADAWAWQDLMALGVSVGAPPDDFSPRGQDWGLPPFIPHRLRSARYEPFIQTIRAALRHAGGLRIDHVMGLFRLFWIPRGMTAADGAFVRYPVDDLLAIVALESHRARAVVVGEDLGTVEGGVRERLALGRPRRARAAEPAGHDDGAAELVSRAPGAARGAGAAPAAASDRRRAPRPRTRRGRDAALTRRVSRLCAALAVVRVAGRRDSDAPGGPRPDEGESGGHAGGGPGHGHHPVRGAGARTRRGAGPGDDGEPLRLRPAHVAGRGAVVSAGAGHPGPRDVRPRRQARRPPEGRQPGTTAPGGRPGRLRVLHSVRGVLGVPRRDERLPEPLPDAEHAHGGRPAALPRRVRRVLPAQGDAVGLQGARRAPRRAGGAGELRPVAGGLWAPAYRRLAR